MRQQRKLKSGGAEVAVGCRTLLGRKCQRVALGEAAVPEEVGWNTRGVTTIWMKEAFGTQRPELAKRYLFFSVSAVSILIVLAPDFPFQRVPLLLMVLLFCTFHPLILDPVPFGFSLLHLSFHLNSLYPL